MSKHAVLSAIARPYHGYHRLIHQKAAALAHGIVSNHGFSDGNKRTALFLVELLIQRSGYDLMAADDAIADIITEVACGAVDYDELAKWFRARLSRPTDQQPSGARTSVPATLESGSGTNSQATGQR